MNGLNIEDVINVIRCSYMNPVLTIIILTVIGLAIKDRPNPEILGRRLRDIFLSTRAYAEKRKNDELDQLDEKPKRDDDEPTNKTHWIVGDDGELVEISKS